VASIETLEGAVPRLGFREQCGAHRFASVDAQVAVVLRSFPAMVSRKRRDTVGGYGQ
jgi:hypothetical protein